MNVPVVVKSASQDRSENVHVVTPIPILGDLRELQLFLSSLGSKKDHASGVTM